MLNIAFLARGLELAPAICRLLVTLHGTEVYGTAFRIGPDLLLTNHHVLMTAADEPATAVTAWFGYEQTFDGADMVHTEVVCRPDSIRGATEGDWAVVRADGLPAAAPVIPLTGATPVEADDRVYIIQHPNGGVKKIGMVHNVVRHVDDDVVQYWTDTEGGSSGAPVFNESWQLVALHHKFLRVTTETGREYRNQGQRIEKVAAALTAAGVIRWEPASSIAGSSCRPAPRANCSSRRWPSSTVCPSRPRTSPCRPGSRTARSTGSAPCSGSGPGCSSSLPARERCAPW